MNIDKALQTAIGYQKAGNYRQAELIYRKILKKQPKNPDALHFLGVLCYQSENYDSAIRYIEKALECNPNQPAAYNNLGLALRKKGRFDDAMTCYQKAIEINPADAVAYNNLGLTLRKKGRFDDAMTCYQKAIEINPADAVAYNNLGLAFQDKGKVDKALEYYQKAIHFNPNYAASYGNLGLAFQNKGSFDKAITYYRKALQLDPNLADAYNNLGNVYKKKGQLREAIHYYHKALQLDPNYMYAYKNFLFAINYDPFYNSQAIYSEHLQFARKQEEPLSSTISRHNNERSPNRRLRIGYVSPDFRKHSVAYFIEPVMKVHSREQFEIYGYSNSVIQDEVTERIQGYTDHWKTIFGMSDEEAARLIKADGVDILIDLAGYTANNRILLFARKPAPIQATWIGYPATTGLMTMDYKIVDAYTDPLGMTEQFYTEKLLRLPESFLCYLPDRDSPEVSTLPALTKGHMTFGSFNHFAKVSNEVIALWSKILKAIPESRLIMKTKSFSDKTTRQYAIDLFKKEGIAEERVELLSWEPSMRGHLDIYNRIDIGLDTFPYNGTTTTCEALWMGVPVVTLHGDTYASRVGTSLLSNVGLPDLIARTQEEYANVAVKLANDLNRLQSLRGQLRNMMLQSPLTDAERFTGKLEACYRRIWEDWCRAV